jgi:hypothetical protein
LIDRKGDEIDIIRQDIQDGDDQSPAD